jgi:hypothetical protein
MSEIGINHDIVIAAKPDKAPETTRRNTFEDKAIPSNSSIRRLPAPGYGAMKFAQGWCELGPPNENRNRFRNFAMVRDEISR